MKQINVALAVIAVALCAPACGEAGPAATTPSSTTLVPTTTSVAVDSPTSSTLPAPTTTVVPAVPPTTTVPVTNVEGAPGDQLDIRVAAPNPYSIPDPFLVRMTQEADPDRVMGYAGRATLANGSLHVVGSIPTMLVRTPRWAGAAPATPLATTAGDYNIYLGFATIAVHVSRDAPPYVAMVSRPALVPSDRQLLGDSDLAGVALGTPEADAEQRLTAVLGPPLRTSPWGDTCGSQFRYLEWTALRIEFRRRNPQSPGQFTMYTYYTYGELPPSDQRLATTTSITLGSTAAELRGAASDGVFQSTSLGGGPPFERWNVPGTQLIVFLDRDFFDPDARVRAIASPRGAALADC